MKKIVTYCISIILFLFYCVVLVLSFFPKITQEYECFFVTKESDSFIENGAFHYDVGKKLFLSDTDSADIGRFTKGWSTKTEYGIWTFGNESIIRFTDLPHKKMILYLDFINTWLPEEATIDVYLQSRLAGTFYVKDLVYGEAVQVPIEESDVLDGSLKVSLCFKDENIEYGMLCRSVWINEV